MKLKIAHIDWKGANAVGDDLLGIVLENAIKRIAKRLKVDVEIENFQGSDIAKLNSYDLIVVGGGSQIPSQMPFFNDILMWNDSVFTPTCIIGTGVRHDTNLINQPESLLKIHSLFQRSFLTGVRGKVSQETLQNMGIETTVCGDTIFLLDQELPQIPFEDLEKVTTVGMVVRNVHSAELHPKYAQNPRGFNERIWKYLAHVCDGITREPSDTNINFIPFRYIQGIEDSDSYAKSMITSKMKRPERASEQVISPYDPIEIAKLLSQNYFIISCRLHPTILSWMQGVPAIGLQSTFKKWEDVGSTLNIPNFYIDFEDIEKEAKMIDKDGKEKDVINYLFLEEKVFEMWEKREELLKQFRKKWMEMRLQQEDMIAEALYHAIDMKEKKNSGIV